MDKVTLATLTQISTAMQMIADAKAGPLTPGQLAALENAMNALITIQNHILLTSEKNWADVFTPDQAGLAKIIAGLNTEANSLNNIGNTIQTISDALGVLVNIAVAAISSGLI